VAAVERRPIDLGVQRVGLARVRLVDGFQPAALQQPGQVRQLWISRRGVEMSFMIMTRELI